MTSEKKTKEEIRYEEYKKIKNNEPIMADDGMGLKYPKCGMCNIYNIKDWDAHAKTDEHRSLLAKFEVLRKVTDGHIDMKELGRACHVMTSQEITTMFNLCLLSPVSELEETKRVNRRKVEILLGKR